MCKHTSSTSIFGVYCWIHTLNGDSNLMTMTNVSQADSAWEQCMIIWNVDDLKVANMQKGVVEDIINKLNKKFGEPSPLSTSRAMKLEYLGMTLDYMTKGKEKYQCTYILIIF